ncbi:hypothetical protein A988_06654 [Pseudomonas syringae BRIP39023]|nr:hypothetical protein A988_06654 [Pseudomonas syringae BRIP39023]PHN78981.1 hypothetical protein AO071_21830 [Pseudomonas syringae]RMM40035.1 hypothetical protein ALQ78_101620 [Pseudomonas syringae pv. aptata]
MLIGQAFTELSFGSCRNFIVTGIMGMNGRSTDERDTLGWLPLQRAVLPTGFHGYAWMSTCRGLKASLSKVRGESAKAGAFGTIRTLHPQVTC